MRKALTTEHEKVGIRKPRFFSQRREAFPFTEHLHGDPSLRLKSGSAQDDAPGAST